MAAMRLSVLRWRMPAKWCGKVISGIWPGLLNHETLFAAGRRGGLSEDKPRTKGELIDND